MELLTHNTHTHTQDRISFGWSVGIGWDGGQVHLGSWMGYSYMEVWF